MKLRLKFNVHRTSIDIQSGDSLQSIRPLISASMPNLPSVWNFSLNGKDQLDVMESFTLSDVGLVSGDLLHIVSEEEVSGEETSLEQQLLRMGFSKNNVSKVIHTFGAKTLNDAVELVSMLGESAPANQSSPFASAATNQSGASSSELANPALKPSIETANQTASPQSSLTGATQAQSVTKPNKTTELFFKPFLLCEGITEALKRLIASEVDMANSNQADLLMLAVHALVVETSLLLKQPIKKQTTGVEGDQPPPSPSLPVNWRVPEMGLYRINYIHKTMKSASYSMTGSVSSKSLVISVTSDVDDAASHQVKLKMDEFVNPQNISTGNCEEIYRNLDQLSTKIKEKIVNQAIDETRRSLSPEEIVTGLDQLPHEIKLQILFLLNVKTLGRLSQTAQSWNVICQSEPVWKRLLQREFGLCGKDVKEYTRQTYRRLIAERRQEERRIQAEVRPLMRPDFYYQAPEDIGRFGAVVPGMIGGRHDLMPGEFPDIGIPRNDPLRIGQPRRGIPPGQLGRVPGARFDPYGPMPDEGDDQYGGGRGGPSQHPDLLQRPRYGRGRGFGGGGGGGGSGFGFM